MIRELTPCLTSSEVALLALSHQSRKEFSEGCGDKAWRPTCLIQRNQNSLAKTQPTRRWLMVSSSWSQSGQHSGRGSPRRASRSAVQHLLCATSHMKSRHLGGAQDFQIFSHGAKRVEPKKKLSYADLAEYCPLEDSLQICLSSLSGCRTVTERMSHRLIRKKMLPWS